MTYFLDKMTVLTVKKLMLLAKPPHHFLGDKILFIYICP